MGLFKTDDEKAAERAAKEAEEQQREAAAAEQAAQQKAAADRKRFLASPVGQATTAKEADLEFFEVQLEVGRHQRDASWGMEREVSSQVSTSAAVLSAIEKVGWRLEHASYLYMVTGESSTDRVFMTGERTAVSGRTVGIYLFRNDRSVPASSPEPSQAG